jgi:hypothetical protein
MDCSSAPTSEGPAISFPNYLFDSLPFCLFFVDLARPTKQTAQRSNRKKTEDDVSEHLEISFVHIFLSKPHALSQRFPTPLKTAGNRKTSCRH